jgi:uncharacterized protein YaiE (UPF0345 family)
MSNKKTALSITFGAATAVLVVQGDDKIYDPALCTLLGITRDLPEGATSICQVTMRQAAKSTAAVMLKATCTHGTGDDEETRVVPLICETSKVITAKGSSAGKLEGQKLSLGGVTTKEWTITRVR